MSLTVGVERCPRCGSYMTLCFGHGYTNWWECKTCGYFPKSEYVATSTFNTPQGIKEAKQDG